MTQPAFFTARKNLPSSFVDTQIIESVDFDRLVILVEPGTAEFAFTQADLASNGILVPQGFRFILPADEELWGQVGTNFDVYVMVTKIGGDS